MSTVKKHATRPGPGAGGTGDTGVITATGRQGAAEPDPGWPRARNAIHPWL